MSGVGWRREFIVIIVRARELVQGNRGRKASGVQSGNGQSQWWYDVRDTYSSRRRMRTNSRMRRLTLLRWPGGDCDASFPSSSSLGMSGADALRSAALAAALLFLRPNIMPRVSLTTPRVLYSRLWSLYSALHAAVSGAHTLTLPSSQTPLRADDRTVRLGKPNFDILRSNWMDSRDGI